MRYWILAILLADLIGYGIGRYVQPAKVETREVQTVKQEVRTITRETKSPDGTVIKEVTNEVIKSEKDKTSTKIDNTKPQWKAQGSAGLDNDLKLMYGIDIERRILGPVSAGAWLNTKKEFGISVSLEF